MTGQGGSGSGGGGGGGVRGGGGGLGGVAGAPWPFVWFDDDWKRRAHGPVMERVRAGDRSWLEVAVVGIVGLAVLFWVWRQARDFMKLFEEGDSHLIHEGRATIDDEEEDDGDSDNDSSANPSGQNDIDSDGSGKQKMA